MTPAELIDLTRHPKIFYGPRGTAYCRPCADKRTRLDKKPFSVKDPNRCCSACGEPIIARQVPL
jgi:hypothetical protein